MRKYKVLVIIGVIILVVGLFSGIVLIRNNEIKKYVLDIEKEEVLVIEKYKSRINTLTSLLDLVKDNTRNNDDIIEEIKKSINELNGLLDENDYKKIYEVNDSLDEKINTLDKRLDRYPKFVVSDEYTNIRSEFDLSNDAISEEEYNYNKLVYEYNKLIDAFPMSLMGYKKYEMRNN